jgi:cytochrome c biogenesis protein CcmG/thiol:disulfide interchange protein DsbE
VARRYADRNVRFYGVVYNDEPPAIRTYIRQMGGQDYPALLDPGQRVAIDYGLVGVPETFFIAQDGTVRRKVFSAVDEGLLVTEIEAMLADHADRPTDPMGAEEGAP